MKNLTFADILNSFLTKNIPLKKKPNSLISISELCKDPIVNSYCFEKKDGSIIKLYPNFKNEYAISHYYDTIGKQKINTLNVKV